MNKGVVALALFTILALVVKGENPELPYRKVCSIQGKGKMTYVWGNKTYDGPFTMFRVNDNVIYNFTVRNDDETPVEVEGYFVIRPDIEWSEWEVEYDHLPDHGLGMERTFPIVSYLYYKDWKPVPKKDYYCFMFGLREAAMLFTPDEKMDLIGEFYDFGDRVDPESFTFLYDEVKDFEHDKADRLFSPSNNPESFVYNASKTALTSLCNTEGASMAIPSFIAVIIAALLSLF